MAAAAALMLLVALVKEVPLDGGCRRRPRRHPGGVGRGALAVVMFLAAAEGVVFQGFVTFLPAFLAEVGGVGQAAAAKGSVLAAAVLLLGVPAKLLGSLAGPDAGPRTLALRYAALYPGAPCATGLSVMAAGATPLGVALARLFSLLIFLGQPITNQLVARSTRAGRRGAAYGTYFYAVVRDRRPGRGGGRGGGRPVGAGGRVRLPGAGRRGQHPRRAGRAGPAGSRVDRPVPGVLAFRGPDGGSIGRDVDMAMADRQAHTLWEGPLIGGKGDTEFASGHRPLPPSPGRPGPRAPTARPAPRAARHRPPPATR